MDDGLKQRLVGALVLIALGVLFVPLLFNPAERRLDQTSQIPAPPAPLPMPEIAEPVVPEAIEPAMDPDQMYTLQDEAAPLPAAETAVGAAAAPLPEAPVTAAPAPSAPPPTPAVEAPVAAAVPAPVAAPLPAAEPVIPAGWVVQVVSLSAPDKANALRDRLTGGGYKAFVRPVAGSGIWRVYIGPTLRRDEAQTIKLQVDKALQVNSIVVEFKP